MNALLVTYLMNTNISLTIATLMQTAQIPKVHFIARARLASLEMESHVLVSDYECSTGRLEDVFKKYYSRVKIKKDFSNHLLICYDATDLCIEFKVHCMSNLPSAKYSAVCLSNNI